MQNTFNKLTDDVKEIRDYMIGARAKLGVIMFFASGFGALIVALVTPFMEKVLR